MKKLLFFLKTREKLDALVFYTLAVVVVYSPVIFLGKSLQSPITHPNTVLDSGAYGYEGRKPFSAFNVDVSEATFSEFPVNKLVGDIYKSGHLPLWNPYKGVGEPIPEQLGSAVWFPYQILQDLAPVSTWDYFYLGRLLLAGFFTFLFLRLLNISKIGSLLGGLIYMFSGTFTWFINNEQVVNPAMMLPIILWSLEGLLQSLGPWYIIFSALSLALILVSAPPAVTLYALLLILSFCLFRILSSPFSRGRSALLLLSVLITALGLIAPLLLPSFDFLKEVLSSREGSGLASVSPISFAFVIFPGLSYFPVDYRFVSNGLWDDVGSYLGVLPFFLIISGLVLIRCSGRKKGLFLFFTGFGVALLLKNYGFWFFPFLGKLPLFNIIWSPRWSGPVWGFAFTVAAALGFEAIRKNQTVLGEKISGFVKRQPLKYLLAVVGLLALLVYFYKITFNFVIGYGDKIFMLGSPPLLSWIFHFVTSVTILFTAAWLLFRQRRNGKNNLLAVLGLVALELWLWVPMGYQLADLKLLPFFFGLLAVLSVASGSWKRILIFGSLFLLSFNLVDYLSPFGLPAKYNPFNPPPYIDFLKKQEGFFRSIGTREFLVPNLPSAYGLSDIRHISGSVVKSFYDFKEHLINIEEHPLWFMNTPPAPSSSDAKTYPFICGKKNYSLTQQKIIFAERLPLYSLLGVKYILVPKASDIKDLFDIDEDTNFPLVYNREVKIYENSAVLPRTFITYRALGPTPYDKIHEQLTGFSLADLKDKVLVEEPIAGPLADSPGVGQATIKSYSPTEIVIAAHTTKAGVLVLTDQFYPGWQASVNGNTAKIYRVDGLFRGVYLESGESRVVFTFRSLNFRLGLYVASLALLNLTLLIYVLRSGRFYLLPLVFIFSSLTAYYPVRGLLNYLGNNSATHNNPELTSETDVRKVILQERQHEMNFVSQELVQLLPVPQKGLFIDGIDGFKFPPNLTNPFYVDYHGVDKKKKRILVQLVEQDNPKYRYDPKLAGVVSFYLGERVRERIKGQKIAVPGPVSKDIIKAGILRILFFYWQKDGNVLGTRLYLSRGYYEFGNGRWNYEAGDASFASQFEFTDGFQYDCQTASWKKVFAR